MKLFFIKVYIFVGLLYNRSINSDRTLYVVIYSRHELVDSEPQWREVQKRKGEGVQKAIVSVIVRFIRKIIKILRLINL